MARKDKKVVLHAANGMQNAVNELIWFCFSSGINGKLVIVVYSLQLDAERTEQHITTFNG